jgi:hypothetical protein
MALSHSLDRPLLLAMFFIAGCTTYANTRNDSEFASFLARANAAQLEFQQGSPGRYKELWSHQPDVTLAGGFGGRFEQGWDSVSKRLDWASSQFRNGRNEVQRLRQGSVATSGTWYRQNA